MLVFSLSPVPKTAKCPEDRHCVSVRLPRDLGGGTRILGIAQGRAADLSLTFHRAVARMPYDAQDRSIRFFGEKPDGTAFYQSTQHVPDKGRDGVATDFAGVYLDWLWWRATGQKLGEAERPVRAETRTLTAARQALRSPA